MPVKKKKKKGTAKPTPQNPHLKTKSKPSAGSHVNWLILAMETASNSNGKSSTTHLNNSADLFGGNNEMLP